MFVLHNCIIILRMCGCVFVCMCVRARARMHVFIIELAIFFQYHINSDYKCRTDMFLFEDNFIKSHISRGRNNSKI